nr:MAG TPA: hypothetical protein [Caudoviricetes sp.]
MFYLPSIILFHNSIHVVNCVHYIIIFLLSFSISSSLL